MILVVMGVAGLGKSTLGRLLADRLGAAFIDADALHPPASIAKMAAGTPLDDSDRDPWIESVAAAAAEAERRQETVVLACSALRRRHRDRLREAGDTVRFVHLAGSPPLAHARVGGRDGHFLDQALVDSQFAALEPPQGEPDVATLDATRPPSALADEAAAWARSETLRTLSKAIGTRRPAGQAPERGGRRR